MTERNRKMKIQVRKPNRRIRTITQQKINVFTNKIGEEPNYE